MGFQGLSQRGTSATQQGVIRNSILMGDDLRQAEKQDWTGSSYFAAGPVFMVDGL
jgi:hypothetical protein